MIYINRSIMECVDAATTRTEAATGGLAVCDLKADGRTLVLLLSVLTVRNCRRINVSRPAFIGARLAEPDVWQSAAMFAIKITAIVRLKEQWEEHQRLEEEYAELVAELEAAVSPENAAQVETILTKHERRRTSYGGSVLVPTTPRRTDLALRDV